MYFSFNAKSRFDPFWFLSGFLLGDLDLGFRIGADGVNGLME